jgi:hypothetical protein
MGKTASCASETTNEPEARTQGDIMAKNRDETIDP